MNQKVSEFLNAHHVGVLSVQLKSGKPHGATVHFSHQDNPLKVFFMTDRNSKKVEAILDGSTMGASFVTGFDEDSMQTVQMDGSVRIVTDAAEIAALKEVHYAKLPSAKKWEGAPDSVFLEFTPTWWRFKDYKTDTVIEN